MAGVIVNNQGESSLSQVLYFLPYAVGQSLLFLSLACFIVYETLFLETKKQIATEYQHFLHICGRQIVPSDLFIQLPFL